MDTAFLTQTKHVIENFKVVTAQYLNAEKSWMLTNNINEKNANEEEMLAYGEDVQASLDRLQKFVAMIEAMDDLISLPIRLQALEAIKKAIPADFIYPQIFPRQGLTLFSSRYPQCCR